MAGVLLPLLARLAAPELVGRRDSKRLNLDYSVGNEISAPPAGGERPAGRGGEPRARHLDGVQAGAQPHPAAGVERALPIPLALSAQLHEGVHRARRRRQLGDAARGGSLTRAPAAHLQVPESLKNMLLVAHSMRLFEHVPQLYKKTKECVDSFMPGLVDELVPAMEGTSNPATVTTPAAPPAAQTALPAAPVAPIAPPVTTMAPPAAPISPPAAPSPPVSSPTIAEAPAAPVVLQQYQPYPPASIVSNAAPPLGAHSLVSSPLSTPLPPAPVYFGAPVASPVLFPPTTPLGQPVDAAQVP